MDHNQLKNFIRDVPDFPKAGIVFRDISPLLKGHFPETITALASLLNDEAWDRVQVIAGIEARGFVLAAGLAAIKEKGFVKIRKPGKLPGPVCTASYSLEYGQDSLEMQYGSGELLIVDDVLATGGTLTAAANLATECGYHISGFLCLINLTYLNSFVWSNIQPQCLITYED